MPGDPHAAELDGGLTPVRYLTTTDPTHTSSGAYPEDPNPMSQTLHQNDIHDLVHDRIGDLYATASELRESRRHSPDSDAGLVTRTRWTIGRRLVSIGQTVAGTHA
jgi:hypothetical protein